jgi:hypothetical protein
MKVISVIRTLAFVLMLGMVFVSSFAQAHSDHSAGYQYMAYCVDGDGALSSWRDSYDEANGIGKNHEWSTKGHRWDVLTRIKP